MNTIKHWKERMDDYYAEPEGKLMHAASYFIELENEELRAALASRATPAQPAPSPSSVGAALSRLPSIIKQIRDEQQYHHQQGRSVSASLHGTWAEALETLSEAAALAEQAQGQQWLPIERAPRDGTEVFLWLQAPFNRIEKARWFDLWENWQLGEFPDAMDEYCGIGSKVPTHYMPLPAPPSIAHDGQKSEVDRGD